MISSEEEKLVLVTFVLVDDFHKVNIIFGSTLSIFFLQEQVRSFLSPPKTNHIISSLIPMFQIAANITKKNNIIVCKFQLISDLFPSKQGYFYFILKTVLSCSKLQF